VRTMCERCREVSWRWLLPQVPLVLPQGVALAVRSWAHAWYRSALQARGQGPIGPCHSLRIVCRFAMRRNDVSMSSNSKLALVRKMGNPCQVAHAITNTGYCGQHDNRPSLRLSGSIRALQTMSPVFNRLKPNNCAGDMWKSAKPLHDALIDALIEQDIGAKMNKSEERLVGTGTLAEPGLEA